MLSIFKEVLNDQIYIKTSSSSWKLKTVNPGITSELYKYFLSEQHVYLVMLLQLYTNQ